MVCNMKGRGLLLTLLLILPPLLFGNAFALTHEEATNILKELIKTKFKVLEIKEAHLEGVCSSIPPQPSSFRTERSWKVTLLQIVWRIF